MSDQERDHDENNHKANLANTKNSIGLDRA